MRDSKVARYFLVALLLVFIYLAFLTILPVIKNIILAMVLAFAFYPFYKFVNKYIKSKNWSAALMILFLLLLIAIPGSLIVNSLIQQTYSTYSLVQTFDFTNLNSFVPEFLSETVDLHKYIGDVILKVRNFIVSFAPDLIGSIAEILLGLFIMLFVMFYAFRDGDKWVAKIRDSLPMRKEYTKKLLTNTEDVTGAVLYGYVLTAVVQGFLGGFMFFILGISNPIFWGFVMVVLAAIPFIGTPIVWLPAAIIELVSGRYVSGLILLIFGFVVLINIDNFIRPKLISSRANIHPAVVLVGVLGGLSVFGFTGIILGPLILSLLIVIVKFFALEFDY
ncbi:AI-2E family transporter [Candidatus Woesearchaeota archaeon]|nr:AI-2E family transporter [Candidatus Woesearchaeota archaeon]